MYLNELSKTCHAANTKWWADLETGEKISRNKGELLMLVVTEVAEAMEGARKDLMDDHLPHRKMEEVELADCIIRILDYCGAYNFDIHGALMEKMEYNKTRLDHSHEARKLPNGKKF